MAKSIKKSSGAKATSRKQSSSAKSAFTKKSSGTSKKSNVKQPASKPNQIPVSDTPVDRFEDKNLEPVSGGNKNKPLHLPPDEEGKNAPVEK